MKRTAQRRGSNKPLGEDPKEDEGSTDGEESLERTRDSKSCGTRPRGPDLCRAKCHLPVSHICHILFSVRL